MTFSKLLKFGNNKAVLHFCCITELINSVFPFYFRNTLFFTGEQFTDSLSFTLIWVLTCFFVLSL